MFWFLCFCSVCLKLFFFFCLAGSAGCAIALARCMAIHRSVDAAAARNVFNASFVLLDAQANAEREGPLGSRAFAKILPHRGNRETRATARLRYCPSFPPVAVKNDRRLMVMYLYGRVGRTHNHRSSLLHSAERK